MSYKFRNEMVNQSRDVFQMSRAETTDMTGADCVVFIHPHAVDGLMSDGFTEDEAVSVIQAAMYSVVSPGEWRHTHPTPGNTHEDDGWVREYEYEGHRYGMAAVKSRSVPGALVVNSAYPLARQRRYGW